VSSRPLDQHHERSLGGSALIKAHQIDLFGVPQLTYAGYLDADHNESGSVRVTSDEG
jgi:hypothetical protein